MEPNVARPADNISAAGDDADWSWPPFAPLEPAGDARFGTEQWAPASTVRHPWVRIGRWTLLYRRAA